MSRKPIGKIAVKEAVRRIYPLLPRRFSLIRLHAMVAREICRPQVFCDSVRRKLFELREEKEIFFKNISKPKSLYQKEERL